MHACRNPCAPSAARDRCRQRIRPRSSRCLGQHRARRARRRCLEIVGKFFSVAPMGVARPEAVQQAGACAGRNTPEQIGTTRAPRLVASGNFANRLRRRDRRDRTNPAPRSGLPRTAAQARHRHPRDLRRARAAAADRRPPRQIDTGRNPVPAGPEQRTQPQYRTRTGPVGHTQSHYKANANMARY